MLRVVEDAVERGVRQGSETSSSPPRLSSRRTVLRVLVAWRPMAVPSPLRDDVLSGDGRAGRDEVIVDLHAHQIGGCASPMFGSASHAARCSARGASANRAAPVLRGRPVRPRGRTPELADFLRSVLERLSTEAELLASVDAYFEQGRHMKGAASALKVHPNTLTYRLRRIEQLFGGSFENSDWCVRLLALKLRELGRQAP